MVQLAGLHVAVVVSILIALLAHLYAKVTSHAMTFAVVQIMNVNEILFVNHKVLTLMFKPRSVPIAMRKVIFGLTLMELLVVVAILTLLVGVILSVFFRAREKGRQITCISNLKQLGTAFVMYAHDHEGLFPPYRSFVRTEIPGLVAEACSSFGADPSFPPVYAPSLLVGSLSPYLKSLEIWFCPSDPYARSDSYFWCIPHQYLSYYVNVRMPWKMTADGWISGTSTRPASEVVLMEDANKGFTDEERKLSPPAYKALFDVHGCEHFEGVNVLYLDNHVKWERHKGWK